jgi:thiamine biosynthesis lipoprotein
MAANQDTVPSGAESAPLSIGGNDLAADSASDAYLVRIGRRAMACQFQVFLNAGQYTQGYPAALTALDLVERLETQMTVYRVDSELSAINREAADEAVTVESDLFDLLSQCVDLWRETDGAFDITAGPLSEVWGFSRRQGRLPREAELAEALGRVGSQWLDLNLDQRTIRFSRPGVQLNLGAIGKGEALDRAAAVIQEDGIGDFLFHGGQSSVLARGARAGGSDKGWPVGLIHPLRPQKRIGQVQLRNAALATSGSGTQFFTHRGRRYGHILDPRTGRPAEGMLSCTVIAPTAAEADALATALYVMGPNKATDWCRRHPQYSAILIWPGRKSGSVEVETVNVQPGVWRES